LRKTAAIVIAVIVGLLAIALPIVASLLLASRQSVEETMTQAFSLAAEVRRRADETADQSIAALERLKGAGAANPCSEANIALMREIGIGSSYLQAVGRVSGDRLICSSLGRHGAGIALGPVDFVTKQGALVRTSVELIAPGVKFLLFEMNGYAAIIKRDLVMDVFMDRQDISLGAFGYSNGKLLLNRGTFKPGWIEALGSAQEVKFFDGQHVVAVRRSLRYDYAAFAAVPAVYLAERVHGFARVLLPLGVLVAIAFAIALVFVAKQQLSLPVVLRSALRREEFFLQYQPIVDLRTGRWTGAEALIRWRRGDGEIVRPDLFIPAAEVGGLIQRITERVMNLVAGDAPFLLARYPHFHISINLSSADLQSAGIVPMLRDIMGKAGISPGSIFVEATERGFLEADFARDIVHNIRAMGVRVAIDDFGTGYSSLSYLTTFEIDYLKIDKSFVDTIGKGAATSQVILHIIRMAKALDLSMIAEGVETESQAEFLRKHGVQFAQGGLFAKPMSIADLARQMDAQEQPGAGPASKTPSRTGTVA
jgi:sensor c-di-GMP phosphodiesterase-like protein